MKKKLIAVIAMVAVAIAVPAALLAWGPSRPTYTIEKPAEHVTFNSITNNPSHGDERNFVQVRDANSGNETYVDNIDLTAGHEYVVYVYFHNNAASNLNASGVGIAHGAYVKAEIPAVVAKKTDNVKAVGYVGAANAKPTVEVWDDISFNNSTDSDMSLDYVTDSATIHSFGAVNGKTMDNKIVTTGAPIGYDALNGELPGCNDYAGYVTFRVKANQPNFTITKQVHKTGVPGWKPSETVNPSDSVDYLITYTNTGSTTQNNVVIKDILPAGVTYTLKSTYVANATKPDGTPVSDNIVSKDGINIGNYAAGANAYVKFSATVAANKDLAACGVNTLHNVVKAETDNGAKESSADVTVTKTCDTPAPKPTPTPTPVEALPVTGAGEDIAAFLGLGSLITSISYFRASRRANLNKK